MKGFADAAALESALALLHDAELMEFVQEHQHNYLYRADFMKETTKLRQRHSCLRRRW